VILVLDAQNADELARSDNLAVAVAEQQADALVRQLSAGSHPVDRVRALGVVMVDARSTLSTVKKPQATMLAA
jgi:hypothetical protein